MKEKLRFLGILTDIGTPKLPYLNDWNIDLKRVSRSFPAVRASEEFNAHCQEKKNWAMHILYGMHLLGLPL